MKEFARDIMRRSFQTLHEEMSIMEAVNAFKSSGATEERMIFGMMVTDRNDRLVGMLSLYDILLFILPKYAHIWGAIEDLDISRMITSSCEQARNIRVADIMTSEVISVGPDANLILLLDIMIKKHVRRIPVIEEERIQGIVYLSDIFNHIADRLTQS
ncbi:MAG: CBS domain-containing protein [Desulfocapsaceae bacterium]|nr:CBS domain-containing protein [Desulfocapsaceae bacterium]